MTAAALLAEMPESSSLSRREISALVGVAQVNRDSGTLRGRRTIFGDCAGEEQLGNDSNLLIVFYVQIMPDDLVMQLHR
ncbi:hypothetical protein UH31_23090, partial [Escherichia coli]